LPCSILFWSVDDGAAAPTAFTALEAAVALLGGSDPDPWSAQAAVHRPSGLLQNGSQALHPVSAEKDITVVTFESEAATGGSMFFVKR